MNSLRTNETRKIGDLISSALLQAIGPNVTNNFAAPKSKNTFKRKVEEVDPVRSAERLTTVAKSACGGQAGVPYSSSHQMSPFNTAEGDKSNVVAA